LGRVKLEKIKNPLSSIFGPVKLNKNDIAYITNELNNLKSHPNYNETANNSFDLIVDDIKYESLEELISNEKKTINNISFHYKLYAEFSISIDISKNNTHLFCIENTPFTKGIFYSIQKLLISKRRRFQWSKYAIYTGLLGVFGAIYTNNPPLQYVGLTMSSLGMLGLILYVIGIPFRKTVINLDSIKTSFLERNKDQIWLSILTFVLGVGGTLIVQALTK
jgi:hypothetical protein